MLGWRLVSSALYQRHRFPAAVISHCVWLCHRFYLSFRDVEELMLERGVVLSYETVRRWCLKFGGEYAKRLKRRRAQPGDKWHVDEVFLSINGERHYLWRAVDQEGNTLDILVTSKRDKRAAKRFFRKLLRAHAKPRVVVTDKLRPYGAALKELPASNRTPPEPLPQQPGRMFAPANEATRTSAALRAGRGPLQRFNSSGHAGRLLSIFEPLNTHFRPPRHLLKAYDYRQKMQECFSTWREVTERQAGA